MTRNPSAPHRSEQLRNLATDTLARSRVLHAHTRRLGQQNAGQGKTRQDVT